MAILDEINVNGTLYKMQDSAAARAANTYTKGEVDALVAAIKQFKPVVANSLPTASADTMYILYFVPSTNPKTQNTKDEFITIDNGSGANPRYTWEQVGSTELDISGKADADTVPVDVYRTATDAAFVNSDNETLFWLRKVDSTNAGLMTSEEHTKLDALPTAQDLNISLDSIIYDVSAKNPTAGPNNDGKFTLAYILNPSNVNTLIPSAVRKGGMSIKFVHTSDNKYVQYMLKATSFSTNTDDWEGYEDVVAKMEDISAENIHQVNEMMEDYQPIVVEGDVTNAPDEEDLTSVNIGGTDVIRFKDKTYNSNLYSGLGRVYLRKNMINGVNTLTQDMLYKGEAGSRVPNDNTIYVIQYDFDLNGDTITIPNNCTLQFEGGCLSHGTLNFNSTKIVSNNKCFNTDINFGTGHIINEEVRISWFVAKNDILKEPDDTPTHDCHDEIRLASLLAGYISSGHTGRTGGTLDMEHIRLAVFQPIIFDNSRDANLIKNGNIFFWSTADGQSIFHYNNQSIAYCPIENCVFTYNGSVETKSKKTVDSRIYHERVNAIRFEKCAPTAFSYWRDIKTKMLTGYVFVNQTYLQEDSFENISSSGCNGMISYNVDGYYEGDKGSSNIITFKNCNLNNGDTTPSYYSKCTIEYLWDFRGFMELTIENAVSQGFGKEGQKAIRLGPPVVYPQSVKLDGFWIEYTYYNVDSKIYIESSTDLHLEKTNVSGFVTKGDTETINIFYNAVASNYYSGNFIDNSTITEGTAQVAIYYKPTTYLAFITLSDKFLEWVDKGIIRVLDTRKYPYGRTAAQNIVNIKPGRQNNMLKHLMKNCVYFSTVWNCLSYITSYNGINTLTMEHEGNEAYTGGHSQSSVMGMFAEIVYRVAPLIDVTEENKNDIYIKFSVGGSDRIIYSPSVGDTAETFTPWLRKAYITSSSGSFKVKNARIEIAYYTTYGGFGIRDYITFRYDITNQNLVPIMGNEDTQIIEIDSTQTGLTINGIKDYVKINNVIIKFVGNKWSFTGTVYKSEKGITPLTNMSGATTSRPKGLAVGCSYFDTTLGKPIFVKTVDSTTGDITWVDGLGTVV